MSGKNSRKIIVQWILVVIFAGMLSLFGCLSSGLTNSPNSIQNLVSVTPAYKVFLAIIIRSFMPPDLDHILISEVMYDPDTSPSQGGVEWIEIYNHTRTTEDLSIYKLGDEEIVDGTEGMYTFPAGAFIDPGQVVIVAKDASAFLGAYGFAPDYELIDSGSLVPDMSKYSNWSNGQVLLNNGGDQVLLLGSGDDIVDSVAWGDSDWSGFLPAVLGSGKGNSIERSPVYIDTDTASDWIVQVFPNPGEVELGPPTATPTFTFTPSFTPSSTQTPSQTATPTQTSSPTFTPSPTQTPSPTSTSTSTPTLTPTATASATATQTPTNTPTPFGGLILVSEVLFDPLGTDAGNEWIEIYNAGITTVDISQFKVGDDQDRFTNSGSEGMLRFPVGATIAVGQALVIAENAENFFAAYGFYPDYEMESSNIFVPDMVKYTPWSSGSVVLTNMGDDVLILDYHDKMVDAVSWGGSNFAFSPPVPGVPAGTSIARYPANQDTDTAVDWRSQPNPDPGQLNTFPPTPTATYTNSPVPPSLTPTPSKTVTPNPPSPTSTPVDSPTSTSTNTATPSATSSPTASHTATNTPTPTSSNTPTPVWTPTPFTGVLLISEVFYDPSGTEPDGEWVEIFNASAIPIDLANFKVGDDQDAGDGIMEGMFIFPESAVVGPGEVVVVANRATAFFSVYGFSPDYELIDTDPGVPDMVKDTQWSTGDMLLHNIGDELLLMSPDNSILDALSWGDSLVFFNPPAPDVLEGHSLERVPADQDTDSAGDWKDQPVPAPGSVNLG